MSSLPKDPVILLSFVNTQLRDNFASLEAMADNYEVSAAEIKEKLAAINYEYDETANQFK